MSINEISYIASINHTFSPIPLAQHQMFQSYESVSGFQNSSIPLAQHEMFQSYDLVSCFHP